MKKYQLQEWGSSEGDVCNLKSSYYRSHLPRSSFDSPFHPSGQFFHPHKTQPFPFHISFISSSNKSLYSHHAQPTHQILIKYNRCALSMVSFTLSTTAWRMIWPKPLMTVEASSLFHSKRKWSLPATKIEARNDGLLLSFW